jgi:hypothetical protein
MKFEVYRDKMKIRVIFCFIIIVLSPHMHKYFLLSGILRYHDPFWP